MATKPQAEQRVGGEEQQLRELSAVIGSHVLRYLGRSGDGCRVQVRRLWENRYRVNVLAGLDAASTTIASSYFVVADGGGNIIESTPKFARRH